MNIHQPGLLHITNGDSAADIIAACGVSGDVLPWRDPMHHGPFLSGLTLEEQSRVRIDYLNGSERSLQESLSKLEPHGFSERNATLASAHKYNEIVLWFEHDVLDQLQLLQLLDWFAQARISEFKLSLICIDKFDGVDNFRGIGQLTPVQMASLFNTRQQVTKAQLDLAQRYWSAYCSAEPQSLLNLLSEHETSEQSVSPFLQAALKRHCQEYPWASDGLTRTERQLLALVKSGVTTPAKVFLQNMEHETHLYIGDSRTYSQIAYLCASDQPLLACVNGEQFSHSYHSRLSSDEFNQQQLCLTELGKRVLDGSTNAINTLKRNSWLGGVHINSEAGIWFWDDQSQMLIYRSCILN